MYDLSFASFCLLNIPYWDVKPSCADALAAGADAAAGLTDKKKKVLELLTIYLVPRAKTCRI